MKFTLVLVLASTSFFCLPAASRAQTSPPAPHGSKTIRDVGVEEFDRLRANTNNVVLDVRTPREFDAGHIPGAVNLNVNAADFQEKVARLDKSKTYLVHCAAGVRSAKACKTMDKLSFTNLVNLDPGFNAWKKAGKPVEKK